MVGSKIERKKNNTAWKHRPLNTVCRAAFYVHNAKSTRSCNLNRSSRRLSLLRDPNNFGSDTSTKKVAESNHQNTDDLRNISLFLLSTQCLGICFAMCVNL